MNLSEPQWTSMNLNELQWSSVILSDRDGKFSHRSCFLSTRVSNQTCSLFMVITSIETKLLQWMEQPSTGTHLMKNTKLKSGWKMRCSYRDSDQLKNIKVQPRTVYLIFIGHNWLLFRGMYYLNRLQTMWFRKFPRGNLQSTNCLHVR